MQSPSPTRVTEMLQNRTATAETRKRQSEAHIGDKHPFFGAVRSEETKNKIAKTLSSVTRFDFDGVTILPSHMKTVNESETIGYVIVGHRLIPDIKIKFSSKRSLSTNAIVASLRAKCVFYLDHLNTCAAGGVTPTPKLSFMQGFSG